MSAAVALSPAPHLAVSMHNWDPYWIDPGPAETPSAMLVRHLDALHRIGPALSRVRVDMGWSTSQPTPAPPRIDTYYNRRFIWLFQALAARGLKPYVVVHQSPAWARPANTRSKSYPTRPDAIVAWAAWAGKAFAPWVSEWECWNEPNLEAFTGPGLNTPEAYVPLLEMFTLGMREGNPDAKVIGGNVSQCDWLWLDRAYALGLGKHADIIGVHAYQGRQSISPLSLDVAGVDKSTPGWEKARIALGLPAVQQVMAAHGDAGKPLWNTEQGWSTDPGPWGVGDTMRGTQAARESKAASYTGEFLNLLNSGGQGYANVRLSTLYQLFDPLTTDAHQQGFSIVSPYGFVKPQGRTLLYWRQQHPALRPLH